MGPNIDYATVFKVANEGSPFILNAVGRVFGLGQEESSALFKDGLPTWTWVMIGLGAGFVVGVRVYKAYPKQIPRIIKGK